MGERAAGSKIGGSALRAPHQLWALFFETPKLQKSNKNKCFVVAEIISFTVLLEPCIKKPLAFIAFEQLWSGGNKKASVFVAFSQFWSLKAKGPKLMGGPQSRATDFGARSPLTNLEEL